MDSSSSWRVDLGVPEFDASDETADRGLGQCPRENFGILKLQVWMEASTDNNTPSLDTPRSQQVAYDTKGGYDR